MTDIALKTPRKFLPKGTAGYAITILLNVSYALKIDEETLKKIFLKEEPVDKWILLLDEFFYGCPLPFMQDFMDENGFSLEDLQDIYYSLPKYKQSERFKKVLTDGQLK
jgi:hypothetical protein